MPFEGCVVRSVRRTTFLSWALDPLNWIYFRPARVRDTHLRRLLALKQERWGDEWPTARAVGFSTNAIGRLMGGWQAGRVSYRLRELRRKRMIPYLNRKYRLKVFYRPGTGALLADWKDYRQRFKRLSQAMDRFLAGEPLRSAQDGYNMRGVLHAWASGHARTPCQQELARRLTTASRSRLETLQHFLAELRQWGVKPAKRLRA